MGRRAAAERGKVRVDDLANGSGWPGGPNQTRVITLPAPHAIGKTAVDLESDPPPDVVVEVDITNESLSKFSLYAVLGVPEIWRYDGKTAQFYELVGDTYRVEPESRFFRGLTPAILVEALDQSRTAGQTAALDAFRRRIGGH